MLTTWSELGPAIPFLGWYYLHDVSAERCQALVDYFGGVGPDAVWEAFLCHLGLRYRDGTPKAAWEEFVAARGD